MNVIDIVNEIAGEFGKAVTGDALEYIIWNRTGYPAFWNIPDDGATPEECFRKQIRAAFTDPGIAKVLDEMSAESMP